MTLCTSKGGGQSWKSHVFYIHSYRHRKHWFWDFRIQGETKIKERCWKSGTNTEKPQKNSEFVIFLKSADFWCLIHDFRACVVSQQMVPDSHWFSLKEIITLLANAVCYVPNSPHFISATGQLNTKSMGKPIFVTEHLHLNLVGVKGAHHTYEVGNLLFA